MTVIVYGYSKKLPPVETEIEDDRITSYVASLEYLGYDIDICEKEVENCQTKKSE